MNFSRIPGLAAIGLVAFMTWSAIDSAPMVIERTVSAYARNLEAAASHPLADVREDVFRDPFLRPDEAAAAASSAEAEPRGLKPAELRLTGVIVTGPHRFAYINGRRVREGDRLDSFLVDQIDFNRVMLSGGKGKHELWLSAALPREDPAKRQPSPEQVFPGLAGILAATAASAAAQAATAQSAAAAGAPPPAPAMTPPGPVVTPGGGPTGLSFLKGG